MTTPTADKPLAHKPFAALLEKEGLPHPGLQPKQPQSSRNPRNPQGRRHNMQTQQQEAPAVLSAQPPDVPFSADGIPVQLTPKTYKRVFVEAVICTSVALVFTLGSVAIIGLLSPKKLA
jgi:hypothetical protein